MGGEIKEAKVRKTYKDMPLIMAAFSSVPIRNPKEKGGEEIKDELTKMVKRFSKKNAQVFDDYAEAVQDITESCQHKVKDVLQYDYPEGREPVPQFTAEGNKKKRDEMRKIENTECFFTPCIASVERIKDLPPFVQENLNGLLFKVDLVDDDD